MASSDFAGARLRLRLRSATTALTTLALLAMPGLVGPASAREFDDPPLPQIAPRDLAAKIRAARDAYDDLGLFEAAFDEAQDTNPNFAMNQGNADEQKPILVIFHGHIRFASNGVQWRAEYDGKRVRARSTQLAPDHWITGFDGSRYYDWQVGQHRVTLYETHHSPKQWTARNLFWNESDVLIDLLEKPARAGFPVAIKTEIVDGKACYVVEAGKAGGGELTRYVISPSQGYLPIRRSQQTGGKTFLIYDLHDIREVAPGTWAPGRIEFDWQNVRNDGASRPLIRRSIHIVDYRPRALVNPGALAFELPYDVTVEDPRLGFSYCNDPWWPEVGALLRDRYDWPRTDLSPLGKLALADDKALDKKPPPPFQFASWIRPRAPRLAGETVKVVLLVFDDGTSETRRSLAPALKRLDETYRPAGLEIIVVEPPRVDVEFMKQAVESYDINYAVCVDAPGPGGDGQTASDFEVDRLPAAVVIDAEGKVHAREGLQLNQTLLPLLTKVSGQRDIRPLSLASPEFPNPAYDAVTKLYRQEVARALAAHPGGEITCRVVDSQGQALAGAKITPGLDLTLLSMAGWGAFWTTHEDTPKEATGSTGPDGLRVIGNLCKGTYTLKVEAPGKAWVERKVVINPPLEPASVEVMLPNGLGIAGQVVDEDGEPVPGATIEADQWERTEDATTHFSTCQWLKPATTDAEGRFRFVDLPAAFYTFEVKAPGYPIKELKRIAAGKENLSIKLKRAE